MMRTEAEIQKAFDATYDEEVTGVNLAVDDDELLAAIQDTLRWVLNPRGTEPDVDVFISTYIEG